MKTLIGKIRNNFLAGIAVLLPLVVTFFIMKFLVRKTNVLFIEPILGFYKPYLTGPLAVLGARFIIFGILVLLIVLLGAGARSFLVRTVFGAGESIVTRLPLINKIYLVIKEIRDVIFKPGKSIFQKVVLIEYPRPGLYSIAFVMSDAPEEICQRTGQAMISVFLPTTPGPATGIFLMVPVKNAVVLDMTVEEGIKMIISGGAAGPKTWQSRPAKQLS